MVLAWSCQDLFLYQEACKILTWSWLNLVKTFLCNLVVSHLHGKNYVRNFHDSFLNLVRTTRIMNTPCMILVSFLWKNLTSSMTRILQISWKDSCQDFGKNLLGHTQQCQISNKAGISVQGRMGMCTFAHTWLNTDFLEQYYPSPFRKRHITTDSRRMTILSTHQIMEKFMGRMQSTGGKRLQNHLI